MDGARPVRSPRGTTLTARSWQTEAPLRMLQNNLDPDVAERPDDLVVYGGTGRAARDWRSFDAMVRTLTTLADDETMLVQSGRPVGVLRTHEWAPRVLIANSNLVGDWATWPEFRRLEHLHRHPGHPAGNVRDVRRRRRQALRRHPRRNAHPDRRLRGDGRRPAARGDAQRRGLPDRRRRRVAAAPAGRAPLPRRGGRRPGRRRRPLPGGQAGPAGPVRGPGRQRGDGVPRTAPARGGDRHR